jgi:hypothetical protein
MVTGVVPRWFWSPVGGWWWHRQQRYQVLAVFRNAPPALRWQKLAPRLGDITENLLQDLVVHSTGVGISRSAALGDAALAPES